MSEIVRVMVVDDEEPFVRALGERLEMRGFTVFEALTPYTALTILKEHDIDVVILDVMMPGQDGIATLEEIKREKPLTEVIMLTGHATVATAIDGMKKGAFDYLLKPMETADLVEKINRAKTRKTEQEERIQKANIELLIERRGW